MPAELLAQQDDPARVTAAAASAPAAPSESSPAITIAVHAGTSSASRYGELLCSVPGTGHPDLDPGWTRVVTEALGHRTWVLEATAGGQTVGVLPLALVKSLLFGKFLVSLPYVNSSGVIAQSDEVARRLIDQAVALADEYRVRYLELRHEREVKHTALAHANATKVLMRLALPATTDELWSGFKSKLRSQIRSGEKHHFDVAWGQHERLDEFYDVFSRNMRDLGTPVFPKRLFASILSQFAGQAELCVLRLQAQPVAAALLVHGVGVTQVPSASSLREFNSTSANMVLYWNLLQRAVERGQRSFDFGRSTVDSNTFKFKKQWGAAPSPSVWQYYVRRGSIGDMRPDNAKYGLAIKVWRRLPVWLTRLVGPTIVRGIP